MFGSSIDALRRDPPFFRQVRHDLGIVGHSSLPSRSVDAAMRAHRRTALVELGDVAPDRRRRGIEQVGELLHAHRSTPRQLAQYPVVTYRFDRMRLPRAIARH